MADEKFDDRVRFNWGYHDGARDGQKQRPRTLIEAGPHSIGQVSRGYDAAYYEGYRRGLRDAASGNYAGDSTSAWAEAVLCVADIEEVAR